ncbi:transcription factor TFIIIB subunit BRF1 [Aspergillus saccharolyticus JOP 1030-1]|uniref:B-related factor 1 n=1 Tax=Aspergillus saccharolyticus JOP 1030-1 TaxID=1450539 RepID=A0A319AFJ8_9EURO|nr:putative transcription factor TFIIIB complex subunit Brf1 [Aspergillus saccharolyticus JOP 1030-1]PYH45552.1 putative transcription factor TFIIIB complex subunit Brf1 [Aspergillus saccharolyticus JOP 1030-1]
MSVPRPGMRPMPPRSGPRAPSMGRLASLKPPSSTPIRRPQPISRPQPVRPTTHPKTTTCPNPGCPAPQIVEDDGQKVCSGCGTVISEANIVSEVTFGETSSGAAVVQGTFVGEDQSHVRSTGPGRFHGASESRELTEANGNRYITQLSRALMIPESASKAATQVFKLAVGLNFIQGRRTKTVAAVSLYIACRRQDGNTVMLIDFADVLMLNVFKLGRTYKALLEELRLGGTIFLMNPIDPESLIYRFAKQLEFGPSTMQVASEAVRIVQRMNRDWMTTGRRPAGICGAALILAARMNNFRRTCREVVYVVKVTEITINQRLNEFSSTESVQLENAHDPPSFARSREGRKPSRSFKRKPAETAAEIEGDVPEVQQPRRVDSDGFAIPNLPIDPALMATDQNQRRQSTASVASDATSELGEDTATVRPKGKRPQLPPPSAEQIASEEALENEMASYLTQGSNMVESTLMPPKPTVSDSAEIDAAEFESDPEVAHCLLSPAEVEIKERIWVHENKDYLRAQQAKALKRALAEAESQPGADGRVTKPRKRRKGRLGDVTYLEGDAEDGDGRSTRASTPAEATRRMLERRGFSKKINYRLLDSLFDEGGNDEASKAKAESLSRSQSRSYNQGLYSGIVSNENFLEVVDHPGSAMVGFIVGIYNLGCLLGTVISFLQSDQLGFRRSMWFSMAVILIGGAAQTCSFSRTQTLVTRFFTGIGTGVMTAAVPVYQSELCDARKRGMYVCSQPLAVSIGICVAYWFDYGLSYVDGSISWRLPVACQILLAVGVAVLILGLPESPRWLYRHKKEEAALRVLCDFYDRQADDPKVIQEAEGIRRAIEADNARGEYRWSQIFKKDELNTGRRVLLAYGLQFINQMGGVNVIVTYSTIVLQYNVGLDAKLSLLLGGVIELMFVIGSFYPTFYADRLGRRGPMMWGSFGQFLCMLLISILLSFKGNKKLGTDLERPTATASVPFFFLFMLIFGASINCIPWVYGPEILPLHVRNKGSAIGISANWLWNFFVAMIAPVLIQDLEWKGYLIFMCFNLLFVPIIYFYYPETANMSLENIDQLFMEKKAYQSEESGQTTKGSVTCTEVTEIRL